MILRAKRKKQKHIGMEIVHKHCVLQSLYSIQITGVLEFITIVSNLYTAGPARVLGLDCMLCYIPHEQIHIAEEMLQTPHL